MTQTMKLSVSGGLLALMLAAGGPAFADFSSLEDAQKAAREMDKPLLIDFYTEW